MNIGFDAKRLFLNQSGLGNYSRTLVESLMQQFPEHHYQLYTPKLGLPQRTQVFRSSPAEIIQPEGPSKWLKSWWRSNRVTPRIAKENTQLFHGLSNELPMNIRDAKIPTIVTIHDVIFMRFPQYYPGFDRNLYRIKTASAIKNADTIVAISEQTKNDLIEFLDADAAKIKVIYQGCDEAFKQAYNQSKVDSAKQKFGIGKPYIICVGTIEDRKNQLLLTNAFLESKIAYDFELILVGKQTKVAQEIQKFIENHEKGKSVKMLSNVGFQDLPLLLKGAELSCFPSKYEGFGIPILESMSIGTPVLSSDASCLPEVGGDAVAYFESDNLESLKIQMEALVSDKSALNTLSEKGKLRAEKFDNAKMAQEYMSLYLELNA